VSTRPRRRVASRDGAVLTSVDPDSGCHLTEVPPSDEPRFDRR